MQAAVVTELLNQVVRERVFEGLAVRQILRMPQCIITDRIVGIEVFVRPSNRRAGRDSDVLRDELKIDHEHIDDTRLWGGCIG
jgi:hypothetical protein